MSPILKVIQLAFGFYEKRWSVLFKNLNFELLPSELLIVKGPNGVGKTTLLKVITGELKPSSGKVIAPKDTPLISHDLIYPNLTIGENFNFLKNVLQFNPFDFDENLLSYKDQFVKQCSSGIRARANLAVAFSLNTSLIVLDEPSNFLDAAGVNILNRNLETYLTQGGACVIATHTPHLIAHPYKELELS